VQAAGVRKDARRYNPCMEPLQAELRTRLLMRGITADSDYAALIAALMEELE